MSLYGRCQDALYNLLWDMEVSQGGEVEDGLLKKMGLTFDQVSSVIDPIIDAIYPTIFHQGEKMNSIEAVNGRIAMWRPRRAA